MGRSDYYVIESVVLGQSHLESVLGELRCGEYKGWHHSAMLTILAILKILCKYSPNILQEL